MIERSLSTIMAMDKQTMTVQPPTLLLETRSGKVIGQLHYVNWNISFVGNGMDEISFDVYKPGNITDDMDDDEKTILKEQHKIWNDLVDLKIVEIKDFARYEISVSYTDSTETVKSVHGQSLEVELAQLILRSLYINEQDYITSEITDYNGSDYDENGNFVPTVFYNEEDTAHSLLHRVLKDKAPHWSIGTVTPYVVPNEDSEPESVESFIRTYTADGVSIYDFLTGDVAIETNVVFVFDTLERKINCYSLYDGIDPETKENKCTTVGEDTMIFVSKDKLAKEISIDSDKDSVKNYFKVEGGDDTINSRIRVVNVTGDYICSFNTSQLNDMSEELRSKIDDRNAAVAAKTDEYEKLYSDLCVQANYKNYYSSSMMPGVSINKETGEILDSSTIKDSSNAKEQYDKLISELKKVAVTSLSSYSSNSYLGITNNIEAYAEVFVDSRYNVKVEPKSTSYDDAHNIWKGKFIITRASNEDEYYPNTEDKKEEVSITITEDDIEFAKQKIEKKLKQNDIVNVKFDLDAKYEIDSDGKETGYVREDGSVVEKRIRDYFTEKEVTVTITPDNGDPYEREEIHDGQSLARLKSIEDAYESCISVLSSMGTKDEGTEEYILYSNYVTIRDVAKEVKATREEQIKMAEEEISRLNKKMQDIRSMFDLEAYFGEELYKELCSYLREDTYTNSNYISDGLTDTECLEKAKELVAVAKKELAKSCVLQRTVSTSLSNLFVIPEFENLYDKFNLFNYIRVQTSDEILKLRLVQIDYNGDSAADINVVFSEQIETVDGSISDVQSILNQASSMATQFSSTVRQASQGSEANSTFTELYNNGLNAASIMLKDSDNNEVTFGSYGLLCKNMGDEGSYGEKQLRIIGNGMYLTDDAWKTVKMAVGQITVDNEEKYGIIADVIVGKLLVGNTLSIENEDSSVKIDKDGITITKGLIQSGNYSKENGTGSVLNLDNGTFDFGGGSLTWQSSKLKVSGDVTADILTAIKTGKLACWDFNNTCMYKTSSNIGTANAMYFGDDGLSVSNKFKVDKYGALTATGALLSGDIIAYGATTINNVSYNGTCYINNGSIILFPEQLKNINEVGEYWGDDVTVLNSRQIYAPYADADFKSLNIHSSLKINDGLAINNVNGDIIIGNFSINATKDSLKLNTPSETVTLVDSDIGIYLMTCAGGTIYGSMTINRNLTVMEDITANTANYTRYIECGNAGSTTTNYVRVATSGNTATLRADGSTAGIYHSNISGYSTGKWMISINTSGEVKVNTSSDKRVKNFKGYMSYNEAVSLLEEISPINYIYKNDTNNIVQNGFYAQDVRDALKKYDIGMRPYLIIESTNDEDASFIYDINTEETDDIMYGLDYSKFVPILWKGWQYHNDNIKSLENTIQKQQDTITSLRLELDSMKNKLQELLSRAA